MILVVVEQKLYQELALEKHSWIIKMTTAIEDLKNTDQRVLHVLYQKFRNLGTALIIVSIEVFLLLVSYAFGSKREGSSNIEGSQIAIVQKLQSIFLMVYFSNKEKRKLFATVSQLKMDAKFATFVQRIMIT